MNELSEEMYKLWSDIVNHKGNAEEKALKYLDKIEQTSAQEFKNAYPLDMWESRIERDLHSIADALPESKAVALKMTEFTDKRLEELYGNWCLGSYKNLAEKLLSQHPDDENLADKWFSIAQKGLDYIQKRGSNWGDHQFLEILTVIKDNTPNSNKYDALIANIVNNREKTGEELVCEIDRKLISDNPNNPEVLDKAFQSLAKELSGFEHYDTDEVLKYNNFSSGKYLSNTVSNHYMCKEDKNKIYNEIAQENINSPKIVERCLNASSELGGIWDNLIYNKLYENGYRDNNFEDRFVEKLNKGEIIFDDCSFEQINKLADRLNTEVLKNVTIRLGDMINDEENHARKWHHEPNISAEEYKIMEKMVLLCNQHLEQAAIEKAKAENNPSVIFVEAYVGQGNGDIAEQAYIRDEKGNYHATEFIDDLVYGDENSSAREMIDYVKENKGLVSTRKGIFKMEDNGEFRQIESRPGYSYRRISNDAYWRDVADIAAAKMIYSIGSYKGSTLVSKNPVTGKFEDVPFNISYSNGDHLQGYKKDKDGNSKTVIYKRDKEDGKFYPDAEFPSGEYMGDGYGEDGSYSISFYSHDAGKQYRYVSNKNGSALGVRDGMSGKYKQIDRFHGAYENKPHTQRPMENLKEILANSKERMKNKFSHPEQSKVSKTDLNVSSRDDGGR